MDKISTTIETITPAKAQMYLGTSKGNRPFSKPKLYRYSNTMKQGRWMLNGVPIIFDKNGHLVDGHHRLKSVIMAGVPVDMCVCVGVESNVFPTFDDGYHRKVGQLLAMQGIKHYNNVSATVSVNKSLVNAGRIWANRGTKSLRLTNLDFFEEFMKDSEGYQDATEFGQNMYNVARILKLSWVAGLYYYLTHTGGYSEEYVRKFFFAVCNLETSHIIAADRLREYILKNERKNQNLKAEHLFAIIAKAWNAYVSGKSVKRFSFNPETEEYPKLILNRLVDGE